MPTPAGVDTSETVRGASTLVLSASTGLVRVEGEVIRHEEAVIRVDPRLVFLARAEGASRDNGVVLLENGVVVESADVLFEDPVVEVSSPDVLVRAAVVGVRKTVVFRPEVVVVSFQDVRLLRTNVGKRNQSVGESFHHDVFFFDPDRRSIQDVVVLDDDVGLVRKTVRNSNLHVVEVDEHVREDALHDRERNLHDGRQDLDDVFIEDDDRS